MPQIEQMAFLEEKIMITEAIQKMKTSQYGLTNISVSNIQVFELPLWIGVTLETGGLVEMNTSK